MKVVNTLFIILICMAGSQLNAQTVGNIISDLAHGRGLTTIGPELYVADTDRNTIYVAKKNYDNSPVKTLASIDRPYSMISHGDELYIGTYNSIVKIEDRFNPTVVNVLETNSTVTGLFILGDELYYSLVTQKRVEKINLTASTPSPEGVVAGLSYPDDVYIYNNKMYIADTGNNRIATFDLSATTPTLSTFVELSEPIHITREGKYLYCTTLDGLAKIDLEQSNPTPELITTLGLVEPWALHISDNKIYVTDGTFVRKIEGLLPLSVDEPPFGTYRTMERSCKDAFNEFPESPVCNFSMNPASSQEMIIKYILYDGRVVEVKGTLISDTVFESEKIILDGTNDFETMQLRGVFVPQNMFDLEHLIIDESYFDKSDRKIGKCRVKFCLISVCN